MSRFSILIASFVALSGCSLDVVLQELASKTDTDFKVVQDSGIITDSNKTNYHVNGLCPVSATTVQFSNSPTTLTCNAGIFDGYLDLSSASEGSNTVQVTANGTTIATLDWTVVKDTVPPTVFIGNPVTSHTGLNKSLSIPVTFTDASVINWSSSDIQITGTGVNNCSVALSGSGLTSRTITLSNCDQPSGTLTISIDAGVARDAANNLSLASNSTASITVDNVAPTIAENMTGPTAGNSTASFTWELNFTGADLVSLVAADIVLSGTTTGCTKSLSGTGTSQRILTVTNCSGNGTLNLQVPAGAATDLANNPSPSLTLTSVAIDNQAPTLALGAPTPTLGNSGTTFSWIATYTGATAITLANSDIEFTGASTNCVASISGAGTSTRTIQVSGCTDTGTVAITVKAGSASDAAGNLAPASSLSTAVTVNNGSVGISLSAATPAAINVAGSAQYTITYTNAVNYTLTDSDISLSGATTNCTKALSGSGPTFTVTIANCSGNGNVQMSVAANSANDGAGNNAPAAGPSANLLVDNVKPTIAIVGPTPTSGTSATEFIWTLNFTDASAVQLTTAEITLLTTTAGCVPTITGTGLAQRQIHVTGCTGTGALDISLAANVLTDAAGNTSIANASLGAVTLDNTAPTIALGSPSPTTGNSSTSFVWPVTYTGADAVTLAAGNVSLTTSLTGCTVGVSGTGTSARNITVTNCAGSGTLQISVNAGSASDTAGNLAAASALSTQVVVDNDAPTIAFNTPSPSFGNSSTTFSWVLDFTGADVVTMADSDIYFFGATAGCLASVSGTGILQRTVSVTGCTGTGTLAIYVKAGAISDNAGNGNALTTTSPTVSVSNGSPVLFVSGLLVGHDASNSMTTVTSGSSIVSYVYKIGEASSIDCSVDTGYSSAQALGSITHDLTSFGAVQMKACFKGQDSFSNWSAIQDHRWSRSMNVAFSGRTNICGDPATKTSTLSTTDAQGALTDSGGEGSAYTDNEDCSYTITTGAPITLKLTSFDTESNYDKLRVYDGTATGTLLATLTGTPSTVTTYTATSGTMTLVWTSDGSVTKPGFLISWGGVNLIGDDLDPDDFTIANVLNGSTNTQYTRTFTVNGISGTSLMAGINGFDGQIKNDTQGSPWATWAPVANGDSLSVRMTSGATTSANRTALVQVGRLQKNWKIYWDVTAPTGSIQIAGGATNSTTTSTTLNLAATDPEGSPLQMYITQTASCAADGTWEAFNTSKAWTLLNEGVSNTVYVKYRDESNNESPCYSATINQDNMQAPVATLTSSFGANIGTTVVDLTITFNEKVTGLSESDFTLVNATISNLSGNGKVYTATVTATTQGTFSVTLPANTVLDLQGNNNTASNTVTWTFDSTPPVLRVYVPYPTVSNYFTLYVESDDQSITSIPASAITTTNTSSISLTSASNVGLLRIHKYNVYPSGAGNMTFKVDAGKVADAAGNTNADSGSITVNYLKQATVTFAQSNTVMLNSSGARSVTLSIATPLARDMQVRVIRSIPLSATPGVVDDLANSTTVTIPANATSFDVNFNAIVNYGVNHQRVQLLLTADDPAIRIGAQDVHSILFVDGTMIATTPLAQVSDEQGILTLDASGKLFGMGLGDLATGNAPLVNQNVTPAPIDAATTYKYLTGAYGSACGITSADELRCFGSWAVGNSSINYYEPTIRDSGVTYKSASLYEGSVCGITTANKIRCRGSNTGNVFLTGTTTFKDAFVDVDSTNSYKTVMLAGQNMCAIDMSDNLYCWGQNSYGAVGNGTLAAVTVPTLIDSGTTYAKIFGSNESTCGITTAGALRCWGSNSNSSLGFNDYSANRPNPATVDAGTSYKTIVMRLNAARCALTTTNIVKCWMDMKSIQSPAFLDYSSQGSPVAMYGSAQYEDIFGSGSGLCLRNNNNIVSCGGIASQQIPYATWQTFNLTNTWTKWIPHGYYSCGLTSSGVIKCASGLSIAIGDNLGKEIPRSTLVPVFSSATFVDFDFDSTACGVTSTGEVHCWGTTFGFQWDSEISGYIHVASRIRNAPAGSRAIGVAGANLCVIDGSNDIRCAGTTAKLLGDSTATPGAVYTFSSFVKAATTKKFNSIAMSTTGVCGISTASELVCWGDYPGDGTSSSLNPVVVDSGTTYQSVSMTSGSRCAVTVAGAVKCWGYNNGSLGMTSVTNSYVTTPTLVDSGTSYKKLQMFKGSDITCGITSADKMRCWAYANNSIPNQPTTIDSGTDYTAVYGGGNTPCGVTAGGVLKCLTAPNNNNDSFYEALGTGQMFRGLVPVKATH